MAHEKRLVKPRKHQRGRQNLLVAVALVVISLFTGLLLGGEWFGWQMQAKRQLQADYAELQQYNRRLSRQLATAKLDSDVDGGALELVRIELSRLQGKLADTKEELGFYRNLLQQEGLAQGLRISAFTLTPGDSGNYKYQLVVQQRAGKLKTIRVAARVIVDGELDGKARALKLNEFDSEQKRDFMYLVFRYFFVHDGVVALPAGFQPRRVTVELWPTGQGRKRIERQFVWRVETGSSEG